MTPADKLTLALTIITAVYVVLTGLILIVMCMQGRKSARARLHELLWQLEMEYRSPQMLLAIDSLWRLHIKCGKDRLADEYMQIRSDEYKKLECLPLEVRTVAAMSTLHHQRRLVSHFYQFLEEARQDKVKAIPDDVLYAHWTKTDLGIIPDILIPIEKRLADELRVDSKQLIDRLQQLYDSCSGHPVSSSSS